jgi:hypothetical protein
MRNKSSNGTAAGTRLRRGEPFNPYRMFTGIFIPEGLVRCKWIGAGDKLAWGRLARYAGAKGWCIPSKKTLSEELGVGPRQAQKYITELERHRLLRRRPRFNGRGQTSNAYEFLWHELFEDGENDRPWGGENDCSGEGENDRSPKESQFEESQFEENNIDLDYPPTNRKNRDSRAEFGADRSPCKQYPRLREALADYMITLDDPERVYPGDRLVVEVMDSAAGATEDEVVRCLKFLREERGLRPGTKDGPHHFSWFRTLVADYFQQKRARETVYGPPDAGSDRRNGSGLSQDDFDSMTDALD